MIFNVVSQEESIRNMCVFHISEGKIDETGNRMVIYFTVHNSSLFIELIWLK